MKFKDALGSITQYAYDANGNLTTLTNPNGGVYSYAYNKDNYQTSITDPLENVTTSAYDLAGRLTAKTLPNNAEYTYSYDAIGRIIAQTAPEGLSKSYTYDDAGNLANCSFAFIFALRIIHTKFTGIMIGKQFPEFILFRFFHRNIWYFHHFFFIWRISKILCHFFTSFRRK